MTYPVSHLKPLSQPATFSYKPPTTSKLSDCKKNQKTTELPISMQNVQIWLLEVTNLTLGDTIFSYFW